MVILYFENYFLAAVRESEGCALIKTYAFTAKRVHSRQTNKLTIGLVAEAPHRGGSKTKLCKLCHQKINCGPSYFADSLTQLSHVPMNFGLINSINIHIICN